MKSSYVSPTTTRQARLERLRSGRAAAQIVGTVFPLVRQLRLDLNFEAAERTTIASQAHVMHPPSQAFFEFPCPFSACDGRFDLADPVAAAIAGNASAAEGVLECSGLRARDHEGKQPCRARLTYTITATYKPK